MPHPSAPNAYPSANNAYPSGPDGSGVIVTTSGLVAAHTTSSTALPPRSVSSLTSDTFTPGVGELLVVKTGTWSAQCTITTIAGGGLSWTAQAVVDPASGQAPAALWTARVAPDQDRPMSVTVTYSNQATKTAQAAFCYERWSDAVLPASTEVSSSVADVSTWHADLTQPDSNAAGFQDANWNRQTAAGDGAASGLPWPIATVTAPGDRGGRALPFALPNASARYEVLPNHTTFGDGDSGWFGMAFYLAAGFPLTGGDFQVIEQLRQASDTGSPVIALEARAGKLMLTGGYGVDTHTPARLSYSQTLVSALQTQRWYNVIFQVDGFSVSESTTVVNVWVDDVKVLNAFTVPPPTVVPDGGDIETYHKQGLYHDNTMAAATVYQAGQKFGYSYDAVNPSLTAGSGLSTITSATPGAVITWVDIDDNGSVVGSPTFQSPALATGSYVLNNQQFGAYFGSQLVTNAGSQTYGMVAPSGQNATLIALELLPSTVSATRTPIASLFDDFTESAFDATVWPVVTGG